MATGKKEPTSLRIDEDIKRVAERRAKEEHRSLTSYIEWLILQDGEAGGGTKGRPAPPG